MPLIPHTDADEQAAEDAQVAKAIRDALQAEVLPIIDRYQRTPYIVLAALMEIVADQFAQVRAAEPDRAQRWSVTMLKALQKHLAPSPSSRSH